uniref:Uncharacterized protein n=1 Tax=mine drainage metagenome TaxID=410659 RepID=E6PZI6_9ZZZZ
MRIFSMEALLGQGEVDLDIDRGLSVTGHKAPALHCFFCGGSQHVVAAEGFGRGHLAVGRNGGLNLDNASDAHALGNLRIDWRDPLLDGAVLGVEGKCGGKKQCGDGYFKSTHGSTSWQIAICSNEWIGHR